MSSTLKAGWEAVITVIIRAQICAEVAPAGIFKKPFGR